MRERVSIGKRLAKVVGWLILVSFGFGIGYFTASVQDAAAMSKQTDEIAQLSFAQNQESVKLIAENKVLKATNDSVKNTIKGVCKQKKVLASSMVGITKSTENICAAVPMSASCSWIGFSVNQLRSARDAINKLDCN